MAAPVTFWFAIGSTYTYLAVMRADEVAKRHGVTLDWRPVDIRHVLVTHDNDPFGSNAVKANYMWHDIARHAVSFGLSPKLPAPYPLPDSPFANRVASSPSRKAGSANTRAPPMGDGSTRAKSATRIPTSPPASRRVVTRPSG